MMRCDECRYYQKRSDYEDRGWCRRYPPAPHSVKKFGDFPMVAEKTWCGEFQHRAIASARRK